MKKFIFIVSCLSICFAGSSKHSLGFSYHKATIKNDYGSQLFGGPGLLYQNAPWEHFGFRVNLMKVSAKELSQTVFDINAYSSSNYQNIGFFAYIGPGIALINEENPSAMYDTNIFFLELSLGGGFGYRFKNIGIDLKLWQQHFGGENVSHSSHSLSAYLCFE